MLATARSCAPRLELGGEFLNEDGPVFIGHLGSLERKLTLYEEEFLERFRRE
jgi:hypothetical protein